MWRFLALVLVGCNSLLGIHELTPDATTVDADPCTGVCECRIDTDCTAEYTVCLDQITSRTCVCSAGYTMGSAGCAWTGVVADPGLDDPTKWTVNSLVTIDPAPTAGGMLDPGYAEIKVDTTCTGTLGEVSQQVTMPRLSRAQPLVLATNLQWIVPPDGSAFPVASIGSSWDDNFVRNTMYQSARACLGAGQYAPESTTGIGGPLTVASTLVLGSCFDSMTNMEQLNVDHFEVVPANANECPAPGTVLNGDAESTGGWVFTKSASGDVAAIAAGYGEDATRGVRLLSHEQCDLTTATVPVSVPLADATGSALLSIYHSTSAAYLTMMLDGSPLTLSGGATPTVERYCVPAAFRGVVSWLYAQNNPATADCGGLVDAEADLDNVTVSNDPLCGSDPAIADPSFESGLSMIGISVNDGGSATIAIDANAHTGQRDLQLSAAIECAGSVLTLPIMPPAAVGLAGPAFQFWYRFAQGSFASFSATGYGTSSFVAIRDGQWHQALVCLDPRQPPHPTSTVTLVLSAMGSCTTTFPRETVAIDDLSVTTDPSCPAH